MGASQSLPFDYEEQLRKDKTKQSVAIGYGPPDTDRQQYTEIHRHPSSAKSLMRFPYEGTEHEVRTIWHALAKTTAKDGSRPAFGTRVFDDISNGAFKWQNYDNVTAQAIAVGSGLVARGLSSQANVGIFSQNRAEWMIAAYGIWSQAMRVVAIYASLGPNAVEFIVSHADLTVIFIDKSSLDEIFGIIPKTKLKLLVQFDVNADAYGNTNDTISEAHLAKAKELNVELIGFSDLITQGQEARNPVNEPTEDDISHLMYTSGTTGTPKGAIITHGNVISAIAGVENSVNVHADDSVLSYLPLAHIFETDVQVVMVLKGARIGFWQGNIKKLTEDLNALQPTVMSGVPRVFSRIYQTVMGTVQSSACLKRSLFLRAYEYQLNAVRKNVARSAFYDNHVLRGVATKIGLSNCRVIVSGAAPLPPYLMEFCKVLFNCSVVQGYGLTETAAGLSITLPSDPSSGHVGPPVASTEVRLRSIPEMGYQATDVQPRGEIMVRGPNVFKGYYKNDKATSEAFDADGFYATGDVGRWNDNGTLSIIDRKKNIFKLAQGEYVASEHVEAVYGQSPLIGQIWVYGNSFKSFVVAVAVPNSERFIEIGQQKGWYSGPKFGQDGYPEAFAAMWKANYDELKTILRKSLSEQEGVLKGYEKVRDVIVEYNVNKSGFGFTEENECMTPTYKLRPTFLIKKYRQQLRDLYTTNGEPPAADEKWPGES